MAIHLTERQALYWVDQLLLELERAGYLKMADVLPDSKSAMASIFLKDIAQEQALEKEARALVVQHAGQFAEGSFDSHKAYVMVKKQLAQKKGFVL
jgi:hypothetical protein